MTPTYPDLKVSHITKVHVAKVRIFNLRSDVQYYSFSVFDANWKHIPFASNDRIVEVQLNKSKIVEIYIRSQDADRVVYICSESKLFKGAEKVALISSRICSKVKR
jgi:hypothetical protein